MPQLSIEEARLSNETLHLGNHGDVPIAEARGLIVPNTYRAEAALLIRAMDLWIPKPTDEEFCLRLMSGSLVMLAHYQEDAKGVYSVDHRPNPHDVGALPGKMQADSLLVGPDAIPYGDRHFYDPNITDGNGKPRPGLSHRLRSFDWKNTLIPVRHALEGRPRLFPHQK